MTLEDIIGKAQEYLRNIKERVVYNINGAANRRLITFMYLLMIFGLSGCWGEMYQKINKKYVIEPYAKMGTIDSSEGGNHKAATSHKAMVGVGVNVSPREDGERLKRSMRAEYWTMAEPLDSDRDVPRYGIAVSGRLRYELQPNDTTTIYPYAGLGFERWRRNSPKGNKFYGDLSFASAALGLGIKHERLYFEAGGLLPFWSDTDSGHKPDGKLGLTLNAGIITQNNIDLGVFYSQKKFGGDGSQTPFELELYGAQLRCRF